MGRRSTAPAIVIAGLLISTACGSRAPLDFELYDQAAQAGDSGASDASPVGSDGGPVNPDGGPIGRDGGPVLDTGLPLLDCGVCISNNCSESLITCVGNTGCRDVLQCALLNCLQGGLDPTCLFKCAANNPGGALQATQTLQCVGTKCGDSCLSAFGNGGFGGGGFGGSGGGRQGGGGGRLPEEAPFESLQSQRNATCTMLATLPELACSKEQLTVGKAEQVTPGAK